MADDERQKTEPSSLENYERNTDALYDVLANKHRRYVISCLQEYDDPLTLADLAEEVSARENDTGIGDIPAEEVKNIYMQLYHIHVPKMEEVGIVVYNQDRDLVTLAENANRLTPHASLLSDE